MSAPYFSPVGFHIWPPGGVSQMKKYHFLGNDDKLSLYSYLMSLHHMYYTCLFSLTFQVTEVKARKWSLDLLHVERLV